MSARILVVEDEANLALGIQENLQDEGHQVDVAQDGEAGLARALAERYDLVILDVMMPKLDGYAVCEALRAQRSDVLILFLTAKGSVTDRIQGLEKGGDDYLSKPVDLKALRPAWQRLTAAAQGYEQAYEKAARNGFRGDATKLNAILRKMEQSMARPEGLPDREWFQHHIYAPGFYTGYGVKTIPGVREALEQKLPERAREQAARFAQVLDAVTAQIQAAEAELKRL